jgi:hypothetical protein
MQMYSCPYFWLIYREFFFAIFVLNGQGMGGTDKVAVIAELGTRALFCFWIES